MPGSRAFWAYSVKDRLYISIPASPTAGQDFEIRLRRRSAQLHIKIENPKGVTRGVAAAWMDGTLLTQRPLRFELSDDRLTHELSITLG